MGIFDDNQYPKETNADREAAWADRIERESDKYKKNMADAAESLEPPEHPWEFLNRQGVYRVRYEDGFVVADFRSPAGTNYSISKWVGK